jgi:hypothetical protein
LNEGLKNSVVNDEIYTPKNAITPLLKHIDKDKKIILPFDTEESNYYKVFKENGYDVTCQHLKDNKDFFFEFYEEYDIIISNPPFSIKDSILERLYLINKPFIMLLPITTLSSIKRVEMFKKYGIDLIVFDRRIGFILNGEQCKSNWFASAYFTYKVLDKQLIFENL